MAINSDQAKGIISFILQRLLGLSYLWTGEPLRWAGSPTVKV